MNKLRVRYDRTSCRWNIGSIDHGSSAIVMANRIKLDVDATMNLDGSFDCEGVMKAGDLVSVPLGAVVEEVRIERTTPLPVGRVNEECMLDWVVVYDEGSLGWILYRQDRNEVLISTTNLQLSCHVVSSKGVLHCFAEMLLDGATNRERSDRDVKSVKLRTLIVHDQAVKVHVVSIFGKSLSPR